MLRLKLTKRALKHFIVGYKAFDNEQWRSLERRGGGGGPPLAAILRGRHYGLCCKI